jgi:SH3-like domain-containing protein
MSSRKISLGLAVLLALAACGRPGGPAVLEVAYVTEPRVMLRDRVATVYNIIGEVTNGERVEILARDRRFVRVRTAAGLEGWLQQRFLASQEVYDRFQALAREHHDAPVQAAGVLRSAAGMHLEPSREAERLYQLSAEQKVQMFGRAVAERTIAPPAGSAAEPRVVREDWRLVRDSAGRAGWVLARLVDLDTPVEVAQYSEGQRIVAYFVLNEVEWQGAQVAQYLVVYNEPRDGAAHDFNQIRVFTWNRTRGRYETSYRERRLEGRLPVVVARRTLPREGEVPVFTVTLRGRDGQWTERSYRLSGTLVRRMD